MVVGAVEAKSGKGRKRPLGRLRLAAIPDALAKSLEGFLDADTAKPLTVDTDGWASYRGLDAKGYAHEAINLSQSWGDASLRLPAMVSDNHPDRRIASPELFLKIASLPR